MNLDILHIFSFNNTRDQSKLCLIFEIQYARASSLRHSVDKHFLSSSFCVFLLIFSLTHGSHVRVCQGTFRLSLRHGHVCLSVCQSYCDYDSVFAVSFSVCPSVGLSARCQSLCRYINPHLVEVGLQLAAH